MAGYYGVQTYKMGGKGILIEETPQVLANEAAAIRRAESLSKRRAGAVAFVRHTNDFDEYDEPRFLARFGEVPDEIIEAMLIKS